MRIYGAVVLLLCSFCIGADILNPVARDYLGFWHGFIVGYGLLDGALSLATGHNTLEAAFKAVMTGGK